MIYAFYVLISFFFSFFLFFRRTFSSNFGYKGNFLSPFSFDDFTNFLYPYLALFFFLFFLIRSLWFADNIINQDWYKHPAELKTVRGSHILNSRKIIQNTANDINSGFRKRGYLKYSKGFSTHNV